MIGDEQVSAILGAGCFLLPFLVWWEIGWNWSVLVMVAVPSWLHTVECAVIATKPNWARRYLR